MAARRKSRKNGRFTKSTRRTKRKQPIKISNVAQQLLIANAITRGVAGTNLVPFLTEGWLRDATPGETGGSGNSWTFSAAELVRGMTGGGFGMSQQWQGYGLQKAFETNLRRNGAMMLATVIGVPIAFKFGKRVLNKPLILPANRLLRSAGVKEVKL
jgi:hypothetical protein